MTNVKFVDFKETPGEKSLGIVTVIATGTFMLRYKMNPGKNGGSFPNAPSYKAADGQYIPAIIPESNFVKEEIDQCIKSGMSKTSSSVSNPFKASSTTEECPF